MTKPTLAVDIDDVCADYYGYVIETHPEHRYNYQIGNLTPELDALFYEMAVPEVYEKLKPVQDAPQFLRDISEFFDIAYLTARNENSYQVTVDWFNKYKFPSPEEVIFTTDKGVQCYLMGAEALIENQIKYAIPASGYVRVLLFDTPFNRPGSTVFDNRILTIPKIERANCWTDIMFKVYFARTK